MWGFCWGHVYMTLLERCRYKFFFYPALSNWVNPCARMAKLKMFSCLDCWLIIKLWPCSLNNTCAHMQSVACFNTLPLSLHFASGMVCKCCQFAIASLWFRARLHNCWFLFFFFGFSCPLLLSKYDYFWLGCFFLYFVV